MLPLIIALAIFAVSSGYILVKAILNLRRNGFGLSFSSVMCYIGILLLAIVAIIVTFLAIDYFGRV